MTDTQMERARALAVLIHERINRPSAAGRQWARYRREDANVLRDAAWELGLLLGAIPKTRPARQEIEA